MVITGRSITRLLNMSEEIAKAADTTKEVAEKVLLAANQDIIKRRREPAPPPPEGGISVRAASRKYKIPSQTISQWIQKGVLNPLLRTKNELYIKEQDIASISIKHRTARGRGKRVVFNELKSKQTPTSC